MNLKVLHIVPWFPNPKNPIEGIFIARHIEALQQFCENSVLHLSFGSKNKIEADSYSGISVERQSIKPLVNKWILKEKIAFKRISLYLNKYAAKYTTVVIYITYPNAIGIEKLKKKYPLIQFVLAEQWSAYHTNFNLSESSSGRKRIANIFHNGTPLIVVSKALGEDIRKFANKPALDFNVVPNIIDDTTFNYKKKDMERPFTFCSINNWSAMKNPILLIDAFQILNTSNKNTRLILAGSGQLDTEIKEHIKLLGLEKKIILKGRISKSEVADLLHLSNAYCQSSNYETFSAICIEALATGTPVIATNIGGMKDFIHQKNGILVDSMEVVKWKDAMEKIIAQYKNYNFKAISENCISTYNKTSVGALFYHTLLEVSSEK
jgi:glycosyltransferase involved in cell wall biosynthesis